MEIEFIDHQSEFLEQVITLGKRNSSTLGLMPRDAYIDHARKRSIVVAHEERKLLGYCMFRIVKSKSRIGITQVCIEEDSRRKGIPKALLDKIQEKYKHSFKGMLVSCREDYIGACKLWEDYGFVKKKRVRSRSSQEKYLLKFWFDFGQPDLFSTENNENIKVLLDLNILIKLRDQDSVNEEVTALLSDWLIDEVDYFYAKETLNEIHRDKDHKRTEFTVQYLSRFKELWSNPKESQKYLDVLQEIHTGKTENHHSDRKQLAECRACEIQYFVTTDGEIIDRRDDIYEVLGITILRPTEFILTIDELLNKSLYEPARLQGASFEVKKIDSAMISSTLEDFVAKSKSEKRIDFETLVMRLSSNIKNGIAKVVTSPDKINVAFFGYEKNDDERIDLRFIRIKDIQLQNTLFNQILVEIIREAVAFGQKTVNVSEKYISNDFSIILIRNGFFKSEGVWTKLVLTGLCDFSSLSDLHPEVLQYRHIEAAIEQISEHPDTEVREDLKLNLERALWPLKFSDLGIPTFIIPIKPYWASQLFDHLSANNMIFGAPPDLSWRNENVYYRSVKPDVERFPGRILWYASMQDKFTRRKAIVACSYLNNVTTGEAKKLFSYFKKYGIYKWKEILELAKGEITGPIKGIQFSNTEVFFKPIDFETVNKVLLSENYKRNTFTSPLKVSKEVFNKIYGIAKVPR
ncbi:GNAT family N-acetyltransferase [Parachryseolinea silvisoli]|uniref:GNAT family N-acetyltransferase n=1 Tax=Parachryseolinea silvisoli TaxID=2873601 RepID=UPI0022658F47|nr:GNAT family N-acetyltransferase [Parachryseolinea silvisoli]MCD9019129.1 GNAT family N-acetyltransferase [Parachryseolinea silvisoli]